jgi:hypothetical protein
MKTHHSPSFPYDILYSLGCTIQSHFKPSIIYLNSQIIASEPTGEARESRRDDSRQRLLGGGGYT